MRLLLVSDVHVEFHPDGGKAFVERLDSTGVDVLMIAGDLSTVSYLEDVLRGLCDRFPQVVYVTGNHEYYHSSRVRVHGLLERLSNQLCNLHWLENRSVTLHGQRFVGCSLWFSEASDGLNRIYSRFLSDFEVIDDFDAWVYEVNQRSRDFLEQTVSPQDVVLTHHLPHPAAVAPLFRSGQLAPLNRFFLCDMTALIERAQPTLWCFGHTHHAVDHRIGGTRLLCNPLGYPHEPDLGFRADLTVSLFDSGLVGQVGGDDGDGASAEP